MESLLPINPNQSAQSSFGRHPIKHFLEAVGLDVSNFPIIKFIIETKVKNLRTNRLCLPMRFSEAPGQVFETFLRITRIIEIPSPTGPQDHRKFVEIEWSLEREPFLEKDLHPANSFLASEMSCPSCRAHFNSDLQIKNESTVKISCPQCLQVWSFKIEAENQAGGQVLLLSDLFQRDEFKADALIRKWESQAIEATDSDYYGYFPFHFSKIDFSNSLEMIFGDGRAWSSIANTHHSDLESLLKGFINYLFFQYTKSDVPHPSSSLLEKTDIQIKPEAREFIQGDTFVSSVEESESARQALSQKIAQAQSPQRLASSSFKWQVDPVSFPLHSSAKRKSSRASQIIVGLAASIIISVGFFLFKLSTFENLKESMAQYKTNQRVEQSVVEDAKNQMGLNSTAEIIPEVKSEIIQEATPEVPAIIPEAPRKRESNIQSAKDQSRQLAKELKKSLEEEEAQKSVTTNREETLRAAKIEAAYRQGMLHLKLQQGKAAVAQFENVIKIDPLHAGSYRGLGLAQIYDQKFDQALKSLEKYLAISPANEQDEERKQVRDLIDALKERARLASAAH